MSWEFNYILCIYGDYTDGIISFFIFFNSIANHYVYFLKQNFSIKVTDSNILIFLIDINLLSFFMYQSLPPHLYLVSVINITSNNLNQNCLMINDLFSTLSRLKSSNPNLVMINTSSRLSPVVTSPPPNFSSFP